MEPTGPPVLLLAAGDATRFTGLDGWTWHPGFDVEDSPWDLGERRMICVGVVDDARTAVALGLVARGAALAVELQAQGAVRHRFLEDLHKLGAAVGTPDGAAPADTAALLRPLQQELLDALAAGSTVTAAAEASHVSRRTANRALADARSRLGATTNAAAVRRWLASRPPAQRGPV